MNLVISAVIGLFVATLITSKWKKTLTSVEKQTKAANYQKAGSLNVTQANDFFLYRHLDREEKESKSSGGSSTHKSSSGKTYGGGGGNF